MPIEWNTEGDFGIVADGGQAATLRRRGSSQEVSIPFAIRTGAESKEPESTGGGVTASDATWRFELPVGEEAVKVGDVLSDGDGVCWTILSCRATPGTRVVCVARSLAIHCRLEERVTIEEAEWVDNGSGPEVSGWRRLRPSIPARIQPIETTVDLESSPPGSISTYRIFLDDDLPLNHNHRLVSSRGDVYRVQRYLQAESLGEAPVAEATVDLQAEVS